MRRECGTGGPPELAAARGSLRLDLGSRGAVFCLRLVLLRGWCLRCIHILLDGIDRNFAAAYELSEGGAKVLKRRFHHG